MMTPRSFLVSRQNQACNNNNPPQRPPAGRPLPRQSASPSLSPSSLSSVLPAYAREKDDILGDKLATTKSSDIIITAMPLKRKGADVQSPALSPPRVTTIITRPTTPSSPVEIPSRPKSLERSRAPNSHRHHGERRRHQSSHRFKDAHYPEAIPASVAALLAITSIPPPKGSRSMRQTKYAMEKSMTVESIIERSQEPDQELSLSLSKSPLDLLLTPPEDLEDDDLSVCDSALGSVISTRTVSVESMPSLSNSFATDALSSLGSPHTPSRRKKAQPTRSPLEPLSSPPGEVGPDHPLSGPAAAVEELDFRVFDLEKEESQDKKVSRLQFKPLKSAFKSNLTASLRALRQAARSFSALNFPSIPPEDFLTRSILTLDPQVPYTDERRPQLGEEPTAALRRYLNPPTSVRLEQPLSVAPSPVMKTFTASIQMQTYKVHRAKGPGSGSVRVPPPPAGPSATPRAAQSPQRRTMATEYSLPGPRQREMRENSDFIRIAVMEMAMRKRGKLDDQQPGRARWALPPRKISPRPYVIGDDGVPARWVAIMAD